MNQDIAQGKWKQLSGKIKQKWGKLTDDDLTRAKGDKEYLVGKLHEQYGIAKDKVEDELQTLGYREDDQDADLRSSDRSAAGRMDAAGSDQDERSGVEQTRDGYSNSVRSAGDRNSPQKAGSGSADQDLDSQDSGSSSFRQNAEGGAGHTLEAAGSGRGSSSNRGSGSNNPGSKPGSTGKSGSAADKSGQQKGGRNTPGGSSRT